MKLSIEYIYIRTCSETINSRLDQQIWMLLLKNTSYLTMFIYMHQPTHQCNSNKILYLSTCIFMNTREREGALHFLHFVSTCICNRALRKLFMRKLTRYLFWQTPTGPLSPWLPWSLIWFYGIHVCSPKEKKKSWCWCYKKQVSFCETNCKLIIISLINHSTDLMNCVRNLWIIRNIPEEYLCAFEECASELH